jgi:uncharacterized membrane protein
MSTRTNFPGGLLLGAGLMYFLDPVRGRKRRARIREQLSHAERVERQLVGKAKRDAQHRLHGLAERMRHSPSPDAPDAVIEGRVRSALGRTISHPGAIEVDVHGGCVVLRGPVFAHEADAVLRCVRSVPGAREVIDRMERHATAAGISSLQGEGKLPRPIREVWAPAYQVAAAGAGLALLAYGWLVRRGLGGRLLGLAGGALALRGTLNRPLPMIFGLDHRRGVTVQKTITVHKPIEHVFDLWSRLDNFPLFMEHVRAVEVEVGGRKSRWTVDGPANTKLEFEAETTRYEHDRLIAWRTVPGQAFEHAGEVRFEEVPGGTRVQVQLTYRPLGGLVGHAIAHVLGWDPKARMDDDMIRMKALLEEGKTRAHRERVELADLH